MKLQSFFAVKISNKETYDPEWKDGYWLREYHANYFGPSFEPVHSISEATIYTHLDYVTEIIKDISIPNVNLKIIEFMELGEGF